MTPSTKATEKQKPRQIFGGAFVIYIYHVSMPWHDGEQLFVVGFQLLMPVPVDTISTWAALLFCRFDHPWPALPVVSGWQVVQARPTC